MTQKDLFLRSEGDAWLARNSAALDDYDWTSDPVCQRIVQVSAGRPLKILEIGCGNGSRLASLAALGHDVFGIEPSGNAVAQAVAKGIRAAQGTADNIAFDEAPFDVLIFGFCLYLCDDEDLFRIAQQADRALANPGWLLILDFDAVAPVYKPYHHLEGVRSRKMDYKSMFLWHPAYTLAHFEKFEHGKLSWTDDADKWVSVACLRKSLPR